ncbi:MAG TPA: polyprenyl synthetase family protein [Pseudonocardiaceae bacterium]|nr:polyprenyl synthetase family protein [Pseudonocardiaceae bacterium]
MDTSLVTKRDAAAVLDAARTRIHPVLREAVEALPSAMRLVASYHFGWRDREGRPVAGTPAMGKTLRPALVFLAAAAVTGRSPVSGADDTVVRAGVAVELVHNFTLIHDDVIDQDALRRHRETVWKVFGVPSAILAGDALQALATQVLAKAATPIAATGVSVLQDCVQELIEGQAADLSFETRNDVGLTECVAMAGGKTGALISCACALGALLSGASQEQVQRLRAFGMHFGLAFQLADDLLGIWGDPGVTGKPAQSDLWSRKKSLPVVAALNSGTEAALELSAMYQKPDAWDHTEVLRALTLLERAGGRTWTHQEAARQAASALACLDGVGLDQAATADLAALTHLAAARER